MFLFLDDQEHFQGTNFCLVCDTEEGNNSWSQEKGSVRKQFYLSEAEWIKQWFWRPDHFIVNSLE